MFLESFYKLSNMVEAVYVLKGKKVKVQMILNIQQFYIQKNVCSFIEIKDKCSRANLGNGH